MRGSHRLTMVRIQTVQDSYGSGFRRPGTQSVQRLTRFKKDSGIRAGSVRHVLEDFVVVINRTKPVKRPVFRDSDSDHIGDGNQAAIAVILMIAGVGGIGAIGRP